MATSLIITLKTLFERDLNKLKVEIESYQDERTIWRVEKGIANSAGNLCLHLLGNLNTYIGAEIGKSGYIRNRPLEFSLKNIPVSELLREIKKTKEIVISSLENLTDKDLEKEYPIEVFDRKTTVSFFLIHLATHLNYHLGQINYHRRLVTMS
ncbi:DinB family protein [Sphingobacterium lactis]|uniref:DinB superfamily protein n=1 Tax=Sphingobacterium lactis TaxID=797291 RepID=A0A1H5UC15_9SPHI|nr:DinB family protein [Sphingobacterium lactis]SEF71958.1 Protein of unknown function [Sphingobacterium lactis]